MMVLRQAVDNLYLYAPEFEPAAARFRREVGGSTDTYRVNSWDDLKAAVNGYVSVKFLVFDTHGSPGTLALPDGTSVQGIDFMRLTWNPRFLNLDARVLFYGCNVGEGSAGDTFMAEVGKRLLSGKGGIVGAATVKTVVWQLGSFSTESYLDPASLFEGRLKVKRYDPLGAEVRSQKVNRWGRTG
jgi:hypothetical protein